MGLSGQAVRVTAFVRINRFGIYLVSRSLMRCFEFTIGCNVIDLCFPVRSTSMTRTA